MHVAHWFVYQKRECSYCSNGNVHNNSIDLLIFSEVVLMVATCAINVVMPEMS